MWKYMVGMAPSMLLEALDLDTIPVDLLGVTEALEVEVQPFSEPRNYYSALEIHGDQAKIWVNQVLSLPTRRFVVAHSLAHLLLHKPLRLRRETHYGAGGAFPEERQANAWASELLMPSLAVAARRDQTYEELAELFQVTETQAKYRLYQMGLR